MNPTVTIDDRAWKQAAIALKQKSDRTLMDFINGQAFRVATFAVKKTFTKEADAAKMLAQLGQTGREERVIKRGKRIGQVKYGKGVFRDDSLAARIITKRFRETGQWPAEGDTMLERVRNFVAKRLRTISYIRSGWIPAIQKLDSVVKQRPAKTSKTVQGARQIGRPKGTARPAKFSFRTISAEIENFVPGIARGTDDEAADGLQKSLNESARDMIAELAKRLKKDLAKFGAR